MQWSKQRSKLTKILFGLFLTAPILINSAVYAQLAKNSPRQIIQITPQSDSNTDLLIISFLEPGWFLVSLPLVVQDSSVSALFPMANRAFEWDGINYIAADTMRIGRGYWLEITSPDVAFIEGTPIDRFSSHFIPGWHLIGSVIDTVDFSDPFDIPDNSILLPTFRWNGFEQRYDPPSTRIEQSLGHWIAVLHENDLIVSQDTAMTNLTPVLSRTIATSNKLFDGSQISSANEWNVPLNVTIAGQGLDGLVFGTRENTTDSLDIGVDLLNPPAPPEVFDAFFQIEHELFPALTKDFRSTASDTLNWNLMITGTNGISGTISWNVSEFLAAAGLGLNLEIRSGDMVLADMLSVDSLSFTGDQNLTIALFPTPLSCQLTILSPMPGTFICTDSVDVIAVATTTGGIPPIVPDSCEINGFPAIIDSDTLRATVPIALGNNTINVACSFTDSIGTSVVCTDSIQVVRCELPSCEITIISPSDGQIIFEDSTLVTAVTNVSGGVNPVLDACDINGFPVTISGDTIRAIVPLSPGSNTIGATCTYIDSLGNTTTCTDSIQVSTDTLSCSLTITTPLDSSFICDNTVAVSGTTQVVGGVEPIQATCTINGNPVDVVNGVFDETITLDPNENTIIAICTFTDGTGRTITCSDTVEVFVDTIPPSCEFGPQNGDVVGTFTDSLSGIADIEIVNIENGKLIVEPFQTGDKVVNFRVERIRHYKSLRFDFNVNDVCGNIFLCDPVLLNLVSENGTRKYEFTFPAIDRFFVLTNHGLSEVHVKLNDKIFKLLSDPQRANWEINSYFIPSNGQIVIDMRKYLLENDNQMSVSIFGNPGTGADLLLINEVAEIDYILEIESLPVDFFLAQNYPNPFNPTTLIQYSIPAEQNEGANVQLQIYNTLGKLIRTLVDENKAPGKYLVEWDGRDLQGEQVSTGVYLYRMTAGDFVAVRKMLMAK